MPHSNGEFNSQLKRNLMRIKFELRSHEIFHAHYFAKN
jgi:hypothetical protein